MNYTATAVRNVGVQFEFLSLVSLVFLECVQLEVVPKLSENTLNVPVVVPLLLGCVQGSCRFLFGFALRIIEMLFNYV